MLKGNPFTGSHASTCSWGVDVLEEVKVYYLGNLEEQKREGRKVLQAFHAASDDQPKEGRPKRPTLLLAVSRKRKKKETVPIFNREPRKSTEVPAVKSASFLLFFSRQANKTPFFCQTAGGDESPHPSTIRGRERETRLAVVSPLPTFSCDTGWLQVTHRNVALSELTHNV